MDVLLLFMLFLLSMLFGRYILAGIMILCGNKQFLHDFGNLCDEPIPWKDHSWLESEKQRLDIDQK